MAKTLEFPDGSRSVITTPAGETNGEYVEMELVLPPGAVTPPPHIHAEQEEEYEVLEGRLDVLLDGRWRSLEQGESTTVPRGSPHTFRNRSGALVRVRNVHRPALRFQEYIEAIHGLVTSGKVRGFKDPRGLLYISMLWQEYAREIAAARPPQRAAMRALAGLGRLLGMRTA